MNCPDVNTAAVTINWVTDVIVPLASALIGGILALIGVGITLYRDRTVRKIEKAESARPFFCTVDFWEEHTNPSNSLSEHNFLFSLVGTDDYDPCQKHIEGRFINSDKVEFIIEKITIGNHCYFSMSPEMIRKGMRFTVLLNYSENLTTNKVIMHITDINHQPRQYQFILNGDSVIKFIEL